MLLVWHNWQRNQVDPHYGLVEINSKARHRNVNDVFVFAKQCQQVFIKVSEQYRVAPSIDLEENSNFRVFNDSLVDVDAEELNVVLSSTRGKKNVVEEDDNEIKEWDETDDNNSIEDEDENFN